MSQEPKYHFHIAIPLRLIGPLTELLAQDGLLIDMRHEAEAAPSPASEPSRPAKRRYTSRFPRYKNGPGGEDLLLSVLKNGPQSMPALTSAFAAAGRAPSSASSVVSKIVKEGLVSREAVNGITLVSITEKGRKILRD